MTHGIHSLAVSFWIGLSLTLPGTANADTRLAQFQGTAWRPDGSVAYQERHTRQVADGRLQITTTEYRGPTGTLIATMVSDYRRSVAMPTYDFIDHRTGYREGLRHADGAYVIYHQSPGKPEETASVQPDEALFSCQGWHYYLVDNLDVLSREKIGLRLILPSELRAYRFEVGQSRSDGRRIEAYLTLQNWFLRLFAPRLRLVYDREQRALIEYEGISNILDEAGKRQSVRITYQY